MTKKKVYTKEEKVAMLKVLIYSAYSGFARGNRPKFTEHFPVEQRAEAEGWGARMARQWRGRFEIREPKPVVEDGSPRARLVALLTEQTQDLRREYVARTKEWAAGEYDRIIKWLPGALALRERVEAEYSPLRGAERSRYSHEQLGRPYNSKEWYQHERRINAARDVERRGKAAFIKRAGEEAEAHYAASIEKLAARVEAKGLDQGRLSVKTAKVERNIETVLTDGVQTVYARTILAWGPIVRPHYRYIIT